MPRRASLRTSRLATTRRRSAELPAGAALLYDYRVVHAGAPNDWRPATAASPATPGEGEGDSAAARAGIEAAAHRDGGEGQLAPPPPAAAFRDGERPILQLTYYRPGFRDRPRNYGYEEAYS